MLKNYFIIAFAMLAFTMQGFSQRNCGTMDVHDRLMHEHPDYQQRMQRIEQFTQEAISSGTLDLSKNLITIPVVIHVLYNTSSQNVSDAQIQSQLNVLNQDFRKLNADAANTPSIFTSSVADVEISFCLATKDPNGNPTSGIIRKATSVTSFGSNDAMKYNSQGGSDAWNTSKYLNIWVCNLGSSLLGYAQFPGGPAATDGVVVNFTAFGTTGTAQSPFNKGRTATHEVGHWLNLRHIWGDANCGNDLVSDTPVHQTSNSGCPSHPKSNTCGTSAEMHMNYMDYTNDACMYMFTNGQKSRMRALFASGGARASLSSSDGCGASGGSSTPQYCAAAGSNTQYEWINNVKLGTINNTSGANGGYRDYTSLSTNLTVGTANTITLTPAFASSTYTEYFRVYIDYNQDKDFDDAGELVYTSAGTTVAVNGTFTVPTNALTGATRMRIMMKDGAITGPCESFTYGEVEDYTVNIVAATTTTCNAPSGLSTSGITSSGVSLNWTAVSGASNYTVQYKTSASSTWTSVTANSNTLSLSGLAASTIYNWRVRTNCSSSSSSYVNGSNFTTLSNVTSATVTVGTGTTTSSVMPFSTNYMDERSQIIVTRDELVAAGWTSANPVIRSLAFFVTTASSQVMNSLTIRVAHTSSSSFGSTSFLSGTFTTVFSGNVTALANSWNTYNFTTPFSYNGSSNLLVEICWNNTSYTTNSTVRHTATSAFRALYYRADLASGGVCANTTGTRTYNRPNIQFVFKNSTTGKFDLNEQEEVLSTLVVYPNPSNGQEVNLKIEGKEKGQFSVFVIDQTGRIIGSEAVEKNENQLIHSISTHDYVNGIYYIKVVGDNYNLQQKLIIQK
jgi:hypothetical protein